MALSHGERDQGDRGRGQADGTEHAVLAEPVHDGREQGDDGGADEEFRSGGEHQSMNLTW